MEERLLKADARVDLGAVSPLVAALSVLLRNLVPQVRGRRVRAVHRVRRRRPAVEREADARVVDVALLLRPLEDFSPRHNLVAALLLHLARERAAVPGGSVRRAYRWSSRHTDASRLTT